MDGVGVVVRVWGAEEGVWVWVDVDAGSAIVGKLMRVGSRPVFWGDTEMHPERVISTHMNVIRACLWN